MHSSAGFSSGSNTSQATWMTPQDAPPGYTIETSYDTKPNDEERRLALFRDLVRRHEISDFMARKLRRLESYDIVIVADDSGSMRTKSSGGITDPFAPLRTRWDELKETVAAVTEIASVLDDDGIDVYFLNRSPVRGVKGLTSSLQTAFSSPPEGYTPITRTLRAVLHEKWYSRPPEGRKKLLVLIATDGQPTTPEGRIDKEGLKELLMYQRGQPGDVLVSFLVCTDDDREIEYLNEWDKNVRDLDVVDDFYSERTEILRVQGNSFPFSRGDWICKMLLGVVDPEIDALDERMLGLSVPIGSTRRDSRSSSRHSVLSASGRRKQGCIVQ
ncbi:hypothetical protein HDU83_005852 [Entophlyctis luteolus]|nr:hypothetical protein HDU83_005852 [Entophlyctis luteolus]